MGKKILGGRGGMEIMAIFTNLHIIRYLDEKTDLILSYCWRQESRWMKEDLGLNMRKKQLRMWTVLTRIKLSQNGLSLPPNQWAPSWKCSSRSWVTTCWVVNVRIPALGGTKWPAGFSIPKTLWFHAWRMGETAAPGFVYIQELGTLAKVSVLSTSISQVPFGRWAQATGRFQEAWELHGSCV